MGRNLMVFVSDDQALCEKVKSYASQMGQNCHVFNNQEFAERMTDAEFRKWLQGDAPLSVGMSPIQEGAKILPFPGGTGGDKKVRTINELESIAIENAIYEFKGNLTEAAKALGIGRATLYRKVKQYNIDPSGARKKRVA